MIRARFQLVLCAAALTLAAPSRADDAAAGSTPATAPSKFKDPEDGRFDVSGFLDTAHGFMPLLVPITEPALGYGAVGAAVFISGGTLGEGQRPNIATIGALRTDNGTRGWFGAHLGTWADGRVRTTVALADIDLNLEFFGLGGDRVSDAGLGYSVKGKGGVLGGSYKIGDSDLWVGMRYSAIHTSVAFDSATSNLPGVSPSDFNLRLGALTPSITLDKRGNFFTPTDGWYVDLSIPVYRDSFGSDRNFETLNLTAMYFHPLGETLFLGVRGTYKDSSDDAPFFLKPYVNLRGVQALRFQGEQAAEVEAEVRWRLKSRFSVLGFVGYGAARSSIVQDRQSSVTSGGVGFRYLIARRYGLHLGLDVAGSADDTAIYVIFGNAWLRP
jgi:outer membrane protein assembly factor BamA